jgi:hypothetical protein
VVDVAVVVGVPAAAPPDVLVGVTVAVEVPVAVPVEVPVMVPVDVPPVAPVDVEEPVLVVEVFFEEPVAGTALAVVPVGTVNDGAPVVFVEDPVLPHAVIPAARATPTTDTTSTRIRRLTAVPQAPRGSIRLPHTGQSFRSFWAS